LFDIAFSELVVIAIVALIVIGPEKLPKVARALGVLAGRMQRYVATVKADINREMQFEDLQKLQQEIKQGVSQVQSEISRAQADINSEAEEVEHSIGGALAPPKKPDTPSDKLQ
jgi:sec-independent protein translocase protein TatB